ncbi:MAG: amidohydrolase family protein, partial [Treponema sp.]|nr:amidohydrolase family protein [Treponema sp.]
EKMGVAVPEAMRRMLISCNGIIGCIYHSMDEADVLKIMARNDIATASDGTAYAVSQTRNRYHPRSGSTFPRFLRLARENALMPIETAVYKITALPAAIMGLGGRIGVLAPGFPADITVFDYEKITDRADYQRPWLLPEGIEYVIVNGGIAYTQQKATHNRPGRFYLAK